MLRAYVTRKGKGGKAPSDAWRCSIVNKSSLSIRDVRGGLSRFELLDPRRKQNVCFDAAIELDVRIDVWPAENYPNRDALTENF